LGHAKWNSYNKKKHMTREQAFESFLSSDLIGLGMEADAARRTAHPEEVVTYSLSETASSELKDGAIRIKTETSETLEGLEESLREFRKKFPHSQLLVSAWAVVSLAGSSGLGLDEIFRRLHAAGLDSVAEDGLASGPDVEEWLSVHRSAHRAGMKTIAAFIFGKGDDFSLRLDILDKIRRLQAETGGFLALAPISYAPARDLDAPTGVEYLKMVAISRLYVPEVEHIQASATAQGLKVLQMALRFGANDAGPVPPGTTEEDLRRVIREAGFRPAQRDALYRMMALF
jgi:cyclic dehypoxanthinyl futalosine synthase